MKEKLCERKLAQFESNNLKNWLACNWPNWRLTRLEAKCQEQVDTNNTYDNCIYIYNTLRSMTRRKRKDNRPSKTCT
jgi:hypothetical protein